MVGALRAKALGGGRSTRRSPTRSSSSWSTCAQPPRPAAVSRLRPIWLSQSAPPQPRALVTCAHPVLTPCRCYVPSRDELTSLGYYRTDGYYNTGGAPRPVPPPALARQSASPIPNPSPRPTPTREVAHHLILAPRPPPLTLTRPPLTLTRRPLPSPAGWGGSATRGPLGESDAEGEGGGEDPAEGRRRRVLASIMGGGEEAAAVLD